MANLNSTTTAGAITSSQTFIPLSSLTNMARGDTLFVDQEAMVIRSLVTNTNPVGVNVVRSGRGAAHGIGVTVYTGNPALFYSSDPVGAAPIGQQYYWINTRTGVIWVAQGDEAGPNSSNRSWVPQVNVLGVGSLGVRTVVPTPTQ